MDAPAVGEPVGTLLVKIPVVRITPRDPLATEMLEEWAAKLCLRNLPGDVETATKAHEAAQAFRDWRTANVTESP